MIQSAEVAERSKAPDLRSRYPARYVGSNPTLRASILITGRLVLRAARQTDADSGSIPDDQTFVYCKVSIKIIHSDIYYVIQIFILYRSFKYLRRSNAFIFFFTFVQFLFIEPSETYKTILPQIVNSLIF